jgi:hypothetical protein
MKAAPRDSRETALDQGQDSAQVRLFDPTRYSPAQVAIWQRLPPSNARVFAIAPALGSIRDESGSSAPLKGGKGASGTVVTRRRLPAILKACDIGPRMWRRHADDWEARYVGHRCDRGVVFLFASPVWDPCPNCRVELLFDHVPPPIKLPRGVGFGKSKAELPVPEKRNYQYRGSGTISTTSAALSVPESEPKRSAPIGGVHLGVAVGEEEVPFEDLRGEDREAFLRAQPAADESGLNKIPPPRSKANRHDQAAQILDWNRMVREEREHAS